MPAAIAFFRAAIDAEPAWSEPWGHLALASLRETESSPPSERGTRASAVREFALKAIQLDPSVPIGYVALAATQAYYDWDFVAAEASLRRALELVPHDGLVHMRLGLLLAALGRLDEATAAATRARDLDPLVAVRHTTLGIIQYDRRDYDDGLRSMQRAIEVSPDYGAAYFGRGRILSAMGRHDEAIEATRLALQQGRNVGWLVGLATVYAAAGLFDEADRVLREVEGARRQGQDVSPDNFGYIALYRRRVDEAFTWFDEAIANHMTNILWIGVDPRVDMIRADRRFSDVLRRIGLQR